MVVKAGASANADPGLLRCTTAASSRVTQVRVDLNQLNTPSHPRATVEATDPRPPRHLGTRGLERTSPIIDHTLLTEATPL